MAWATALGGDSDEDHPVNESPRDRRWTRPAALLVLVLVVAAAAWLIWAKDNPTLGILVLIVVGGSALFVAGTARPS